MKKVFIFHICSECGDPTGIVDPCKEIGYNNFPYTNFHGELSVKDTEKLKSDIVETLIKEGKIDRSKYIEKCTKVMEITFNI